MKNTRNKKVRKRGKPKSKSQVVALTKTRISNLRYRTNGLYLLVFFLLSFFIYRGLQSRWILQNGDSAGYVDMFRNRDIKEFSSFTYGSSLFQLLKIISDGPSVFEDKNFLNQNKDFNVFNSHAYLLPYIFRSINKSFFSVELIPLLLIATSYAFGIVLLLKLGKLAKLNAIQSISALGILLSSPIFYESLEGQPYMDRIFFGPCIAVMYLIYSNKYLTRNGFATTVLLVFTAVLISERASLMIGVILLLQVGFRLLAPSNRNIKTFSLLLISFVAIFWYFSWDSVFNLTNYSAVVSPADIFRNTSELIIGARQSNFQTLILCLLPFALIGLLSLRYLLISLITIMPNLLLTIGGAELTGFSTHYHALYLPVICFLLFAKVSRSNSFVGEKTRTWIYMLAATLGVFASISFLGQSDQSKPKLENLNLVVKHIGNAMGALPADIRDSREYLKNERINLTNINTLNQAMRVSSPEGLMPALTYAGIRDIDYFPVGLGYNNFIFVPYVDNSFEMVDISLYGQVPTVDRDEWSSIISTILRAKYNQIERYTGPLGNIAVYQLKY